MPEDKKSEFLRKLKALLVEYDVTIDFSYEGDSHGIHDEKVRVCHRVSPDSFEEETWLDVDYRSYLSAEDIC